MKAQRRSPGGFSRGVLGADRALPRQADRPGAGHRGQSCRRGRCRPGNIFAQAFKHKEKLLECQICRRVAPGDQSRQCAGLATHPQAARMRKCIASSRSFPTVPVTTGGDFSGVDLRDLLTRIIDALPARSACESMVVLRFIEHRSHKEIAETLKVPLGTVASLICNATQLLHERISGRMELDRDPAPPISSATSPSSPDSTGDSGVQS